MPRYILKFHDEKFDKDYYLEWSTVVDAPVTYGMSKNDFTEYYINRYGTSSKNILEERMERVEEYGSSSFNDMVDGIERYFNFNRAGDDGAHIGKQELLDKYCRQNALS